MLTLYNTLSGSKESFLPHKSPHVSMYVCGITPYDHAHLGHARGAICFDVLYRLLTVCNYTVTYVRNVTDIDDKLIHKAEAVYGDPHKYHEIAQQYTKQYQQELKALYCIPPTHEPLVTAHIPEIIVLIEKLIHKGHAYVVDGDVYFAIHTFPDYGKLSDQSIAELQVGARIHPNEKKRDPLDFTLWKSESPGTFFKSPWGFGRPGWHIECSALSLKYLSAPIDIHGGGLDLKFPHHENEIAQSEAAIDDVFVRFWVHNGLITVGHEKMSKSLGNMQTVATLLKKYDPQLIRYFVLSHHYRQPQDFTHAQMQGLAKSYQRLVHALQSAKTNKTYTIEELQHLPITRQMIEFLLDDLNTPGMFGVVFEHLDAIINDGEQAHAIVYIMTHVLGLPLEPVQQITPTITPEIQALIDARIQARREKDFKKADAIRDQLIALGVPVTDEKL